MLVSIPISSAVVRTWDGGGADNNWNSCANWSSDTCPSSADVATFDATSTKNATINVSINVSGIDINTGYTGIITQSGGNSVTTGGGNYDQAAGTFTGSSAGIDNNGAFILSGGTYTDTSGSHTVTGSFTVSGGTYNHNSGTLVFSGNGSTIDVVTSLALQNLTINASSASIKTVQTGDTLVVNGTLVLQNGLLGTGTINAKNIVDVRSTWDGGASNSVLTVDGNAAVTSTFAGGGQEPAVTLNFNAPNQVYQYTGTGTAVMNIVNWQAGNLTPNGATTFSGAFTMSGGTVNAGSTNTFSAAFSQSAGTFNGGSATLNFNNTFTLSSTAVFNATSGNTTLNSTVNLTGGTFNSGTGTVVFSGNSATIDVATSQTFNHLTFSSNNVSTRTVAGGDTLVVNGTLTLTDGSLGGAVNAKSTLTVGSSWDGGAAGSTLTIDGSNTATGTLNAANEPAETVTLNNSNYLLQGAGSSVLRIFNLQAGTLTFTGTSTVRGAMTVSGGTVNTSGTETFTAAYSQSAGTFNGSSATALTFNSTFTLSGTAVFNATSGNTSLPSTVTLTGGTFNSGTGTVILSGNSATIDVNTSQTFNHLTFSSNNGSTRTVASGDTLVVNGTLTFTDGSLGGAVNAKSTLTVASTWDGGAAGSTLMIDGSGTATGTLNANEPAETVTLNNSNYTLQGAGSSLLKIFNLQAGTLTFTGSSTVTGAMTVSGGTVNASGTDTFSAAFSQSAGTFNGGSATLDFNSTFTLSSTAVFNATSGSMSIANSVDLTGGTFNAGTGTVVFDGGSINTSINVATSQDFNHVTFNPASLVTKTISTGDTLVVNGTLTLTEGSVDTGTLSAKGNVSVGSGWDGGNAPLHFTGTGTQTFTLATAGSFDADITVNKTSGSVTLASALTLNANSQDLTLVEGVFDLAGFTLIVNGSSGTVVAQDGATFKLQGGETTTFNASNPTLQAGSAIYYYGTSGPYTLKDWSYKNLTIDGAGAVFSLPATKTVGENLTLTNGTLALASFNLTVTGTFTNNATLRLQGGETTTLTQDTDSGIWEYAGDADGAAESWTIKDFGVTDYFSLKINDNNATKDSFALGANVKVDGVFTVSSGTFTQSTYTVTTPTLTVNGGTFSGGSNTLDINGNLSVSSGTFTASSGNTTVSGDVSYSGGSFAHNNGTVVLDGSSQAITGAITFKHLTKTTSSAAVLTLPASTTVTVEGTLTLQGASGNLLSLRSSSNGVQTSLDPQGTRDLSYLDVMDNNNINAAIVPCRTGCVNSNNNTNWAVGTPGVTVTQSGGTTVLSEAGTTDTYTIVLAASPTASVTVTVTPNSQQTVDNGTLTFTTNNWNTPQTVTVTAVDDLVAEGTHSGSIAHTASSSDTGYNAISIATVAPSITDNDTAGVTVTESAGSTTATEGGSGDTYTVVLTSLPTNTVTVTVTPNSQVSVSPSTLTFTTLNWNQAQTVTVSAVNDNVAEGSHTGSVAHSTASSDSNYNNIAVASVSVSLTDNDAAAITASHTDGTTAVTEGGATDTYALVLGSQPTGDVTIAISGGSQVTVSSSSVTFTVENWSTPQSITVTAVNDNVAEGAHSQVIANVSSSGDSSYNNVTVNLTASITDNDTAGVTITEAGGTAITEGGATDTYTVVLTSLPSSSVTVTVTPNSQQTVSTSSLTFTTDNWNVAQTVTVTSVNDSVAEGSHAGSITHSTSSGDSAYNNLVPSSVTPTITDNDTAGVTVTQSGGSTAITEGGATDTYTVVLTSQPTNNVTVTVSGGAQTNVSPALLTFTSVNWNQAQTVTVTAVDDSVAEGSHTATITQTAASADSNYNAIAVTSVNASIADNETAAVTLVESSFGTTIAEGGATDTYTVVLATEPTATVTVTVTTDLAGHYTASPTTLTFTTDNWDTAQTVTVTAIEDTTVEATQTGTITHVASSADTNYSGIAVASVTVTLTDNDVTIDTATNTGVTLCCFGGSSFGSSHDSSDDEDSSSGDDSTEDSSDDEDSSTDDGTSLTAEDLGLEVPTHWAGGYLKYLLDESYVVEIAVKDQSFLDVLTDMVTTPNNQMSRGDVAEFLVVLSGVDLDTVVVNSNRPAFKDLDLTASQSAYIEFAYQAGLVDGYSDGTFKPDQVVNRAEALKMVANFFNQEVDEDLKGRVLLDEYGMKKNPYTDLALDAWYAPYVVFAHYNGIVSGYGDGTFGPGNSVTHAELLKIATLVRNLDQLDKGTIPALQEVLE